MGRKVSLRERAATDAALDILKTSQNQNIKTQLVKLLLESDAREKARVDAREKQRRQHAHDKKLADLHAQIDCLTKDIQIKDEFILSAKVQADQLTVSAEADQKKKVEELRGQVAATEKTNKSLNAELGQAKQEILDAEYFIVGLVAYRELSEYNPKILDMALQSRIKTEVCQADKIKAGKVIAMLDPEFRELQDDLQKLANLKLETRGPLALFDIATDSYTDTQSRNEARRSLTLLFGWTNFGVSRDSGNQQWWESFSPQIRDLKRRPDSDIMRTIQSQRDDKLGMEEWQARVKGDNDRAEKLSHELLTYRQCSNCAHVSRIQRTRHGRCHHCGKPEFGPQAMKWLSAIKTDVPFCAGVFPCEKDS